MNYVTFGKCHLMGRIPLKCTIRRGKLLQNTLTECNNMEKIRMRNGKTCTEEEMPRLLRPFLMSTDGLRVTLQNLLWEISKSEYSVPNLNSTFIVFQFI